MKDDFKRFRQEQPQLNQKRNLIQFAFKLAEAIQRERMQAVFDQRQHDSQTEKDNLQRERDALQGKYDVAKTTMQQQKITISVTESKLQEMTKQLEDMKFRYDTENKRFIALDKSYHIFVVGAITVGSCLGIAVIVLIILFLVKMRKNNMTPSMHRISANNRRSQNGDQLHVGDEVIIGKLHNDRPPIEILVGECDHEKSGLSEVHDAGAKGNLVRLTRPRETAGALRMFSAGLLNIASIYHDQREQNAECSTTSSDVMSYGLDDEQSKEIELWRRKEFWTGWEYPWTNSVLVAL